MNEAINDNSIDLNKLDKIYLFGYGSLLWKVEFSYTKKIFGYVKGYVRQFWLLSDDHRGTPEKPGRVVTLVKSDNHDEDRVYGVAYEINSSDKNATFEYLNYREKCGYSLNEVIFYPSSDNDTRSLNCVCYFANPDNKYYSPNLTLNEMALHIHQSHGPSGPNKEYLFRLCESLKMLAKLNFVKNNNSNNNNSNNNFDSNEKDADEILNKEILIYDKHLFELEALVRNL